MEQQTGYGNGEQDRLTDEELEMLDEIPVWHLNFFLNMPPDYAKDGLSNIEKIRSGLDRFKSDNSARYNGAVFQVHEYDMAVRGIHEIDSVGSVLRLMFPIMGFYKEKNLLRIRLLRAAGVDVTNVSTNPPFKEAYELDKQTISIKALRLYIECNVFFTDYLCVATMKIWQKYVDQNKNYHSSFDNAVDAALFGDEARTPDGLPFPWLIKENEPGQHEKQAPGRVIIASYRLFRQKFRRNPDPKDIEDLKRMFELISSESINPFEEGLVINRTNTGNVYLDEIKLKGKKGSVSFQYIQDKGAQNAKQLTFKDKT